MVWTLGQLSVGKIDFQKEKSLNSWFYKVKFLLMGFPYIY